MSKKTTTFFSIFFILLVTALCVFLIFKFSEKENPMKNFKSANQPRTTSPVRTVIAEALKLQDFIITNGEIETQSSIEVFPSIGGKVVQMNISLGSPVKKGDVLAYIDPSEAGTYYVKSPVIAPISGSIITSPVKAGQKVSISSVITKIGDIDNLQIRAKIPERHISELKIGQKADIKLQAYPDIIFSASVVKISPVVDPATRTKEILLNFDQKDSRINAGMFANLTLYTTVYEGLIAIEQEALINIGDDYYLYVVKEDNTVERRLVTLGKNVDGYYQITSGINAGEEIVVEGMLTLYDGATVNIINE